MLLLFALLLLFQKSIVANRDLLLCVHKERLVTLLSKVGGNWEQAQGWSQDWQRASGEEGVVIQGSEDRMELRGDGI